MRDGWQVDEAALGKLTREQMDHMIVSFKKQLVLLAGEIKGLKSENEELKKRIKPEGDVSQEEQAQLLAAADGAEEDGWQGWGGAWGGSSQGDPWSKATRVAFALRLACAIQMHPMLATKDASAIATQCWLNEEGAAETWGSEENWVGRNADPDEAYSNWDAWDEDDAWSHAWCHEGEQASGEMAMLEDFRESQDGGGAKTYICIYIYIYIRTYIYIYIQTNVVGVRGASTLLLQGNPLEQGELPKSPRGRTLEGGWKSWEGRADEG